jgi:hypothetical protein
MKNSAAIKRAVAAFSAHAVFPASLTFSEIGKVLGGNGRFFLK